MKRLAYYLFLIVVALVFTACEKSDDEDSPAIATVEDDIISDLIYEDIFSEVESAMSEMEAMLYDGFKKSGWTETCKTIIVEFPGDTIKWPRTVILDYGEGCTGPGGVNREGRIIIEVTRGRVWLKDYKRTITFDNYYVDGMKIEGTKIIANEGKNTNGNIYFSEVLTGGKVIREEGQEILRNFEREREWVAGFHTPNFRHDDEYLVTGMASGIDRKGRTYTRTISNPLHVKISCRWIVAGTILFKVEGLPEASLDYGEGECDRFATLTIKGIKRNIRLHR